MSAKAPSKDTFDHDFQPGIAQAHQDNKMLVLEFQKELDLASGPNGEEVIRRYTSSDYRWHGVYPFEEQEGAEAVADIFYRPLLNAWEHVQRRQDILFAGTSVLGGDWVVSMGHFAGMFARDWLDIPASGKMTFLRYCEFHRVEGGHISETFLLVDLIGVMMQAGVNPLPPQMGAELIVPGPRTQDGILLESQGEAESAKTLELIQRMARDLGDYRDIDMDPHKLAETWHDDMIWYGPSGVGSTIGIDGFKRQHQRPFRKALYSNRVHNGHSARLTEGVYGGWVGYPSLTLTVTGGGFLGLPATNTDIDMRVVDLYRREGDKIAENWVFIDLLYTLVQQDLDIFERMRQLVRVT